MSENENVERLSEVGSIKDLLDNPRKRGLLSWGREKDADIDAEEMVTLTTIQVRSEDKAADKSEIAYTVSISTFFSGTFSNSSENSSDPFLAAPLPIGDEISKSLNPNGIDWDFEPAGTQLSCGHIAHKKPRADLARRLLLDNPQFPEFKHSNWLNPDLSDSMPLKINNPFCRGTSTIDSFPNFEEETRRKPGPDRAAAHGNSAALPPYTDSDKEVMRSKIEFMLNNLDIESQTEMVKKIIIQYVERREACLTMSAIHGDIYDDIVKPVFGEAFLSNAFKDLFTSFDGIFENINVALPKNYQNWVDAGEIVRDLADNTVDLQDLADVVEEGTQTAGNMQLPVVGGRRQYEPGDTTISSVSNPSLYRPDIIPRVIADEVIVNTGGTRMNGADLAALQASFTQLSGGGSGPATRKQGVKNGKAKGKGNGKKR